MKKSIYKSVLSFKAITLAAVFIVGVIFFSFSSVSYAGDNNDHQKGRLITIHDRGSEKVILSQAATIGDALKEAKITIDSKDVVEPAVSEKLVASDYQVNIYRARPVIVVDGTMRTKIITPYQTASQIIESAGIKIFDEDKTSLELTSDIIAEGAGLKLTIDRAVPFNFVLYGKTSLARTHGKTIGEMLAEKGVKLGINDRVMPNANTPLTEGLSVRVWREGKQTVTVDEAVDFEIEKIENADLPMSFREIKTAGVKGMRSVSYEINIIDGVEVNRVEIASIIINQPKKQVEMVGVKGQYTTPTENENITWDYLTSHGFNRIQAAGIMGNLMQEHHFLTSGDGLAQWTGSRKAELFSMPYPTNIYTQLDFLLHELTTNYASVGNAIKNSTTLYESVKIFQDRYEKCGYCMESLRLTYAQNILASH